MVSMWLRYNSCQFGHTGAPEARSVASCHASVRSTSSSTSSTRRASEPAIESKVHELAIGTSFSSPFQARRAHSRGQSFRWSSGFLCGRCGDGWRDGLLRTSLRCSSDSMPFLAQSRAAAQHPGSSRLDSKSGPSLRKSEICASIWRRLTRPPRVPPLSWPGVTS